jgi:hypothetical protein
MNPTAPEIIISPYIRSPFLFLLRLAMKSLR